MPFYKKAYHKRTGVYFPPCHRAGRPRRDEGTGLFPHSPPKVVSLSHQSLTIMKKLLRDFFIAIKKTGDSY